MIARERETSHLRASERVSRRLYRQYIQDAWLQPTRARLLLLLASVHRCWRRSVAALGQRRHLGVSRRLWHWRVGPRVRYSQCRRCSVMPVRSLHLGRCQATESVVDWWSSALATHHWLDRRLGLAGSRGGGGGGSSARRGRTIGRSFERVLGRGDSHLALHARHWLRRRSTEVGLPTRSRLGLSAFRSMLQLWVRLLNSRHASCQFQTHAHTASCPSSSRTHCERYWRIAAVCIELSCL